MGPKLREGPLHGPRQTYEWLKKSRQEGEFPSDPSLMDLNLRGHLIWGSSPTLPIYDIGITENGKASFNLNLVRTLWKNIKSFLDLWEWSVQILSRSG